MSSPAEAITVPCEVMGGEILPTFYDFLEGPGREKRLILLMGGAGSGKSHALAQHIPRLVLQNDQVDLRVLVLRKTFKSLRDTAYRGILEVLNRWGVDYQLNRSLHTLQLGKSEMWFRGLDDPEKIKSTEFNLILIEEATDLTEADFEQLDLRLRRPGPLMNQIFMAFNPISTRSWAVKLALSGRPDVAVMRSTYKDNPILQEARPEYIRKLEDLKNRNVNLHRIYALGEPGVLKGVIYDNWTTIDEAELPEDVKSHLQTPDSMGVDFGSTNPMALVENWATDKDDYGRERLYRTGMTNRSFIEWLGAEKIPRDPEMFCDPSEPDRIQEICDAGWNAKPADSRSVMAGIDYCKGRRYFIFGGSTNLLKEIETYVWKVDKDNNPLDKPVEFNDHSMDAMRYARWSPRSRAGQDTDVDIVKEMEGLLSRRDQNQW